MENEIKVIKIINDTTLVINVGSEDSNIKIGDQFQIISLDGDDLIDPDSGYSIGKLPVYKSKVFATDIYENFSIVRSKYIEEKKNNTMLNPLMPITVVPAHRAPMNVNPDEITGGLFGTEDQPISIGDIAKPVNI